MRPYHHLKLPLSGGMLPSYLTGDALDETIRRALAEDVGSGDVTTLATVAADTPAEARLQAKEDGVVAGLEVAARVFAAVDADVTVRWQAEDGAVVNEGKVVGTLSGPAHSLLTGERLALNFLQRMSGIATATARFVKAARPHGAKILDTRKTAPGLRPLDKWAVRLGGGANHRLGLFDLILIKDNHIVAAGSIEAALEAARTHRAARAPNLKIEIETRTLEEVRAVVGAHQQHGGVDFVLLDNMARAQPDGTITTDRLREAVELVGGQIETEASGNVTLETVPAIAATGVDAISSGRLTHSVRALDLSMEILL